MNPTHFRSLPIIQQYIKLVFSAFKIRYLFSAKDSIPRELRSCVVYKFLCANCNVSYIGETTRHFSTRVREHLHSAKSSHVYKQLKASEECKNSCSPQSFTILDSAATKFLMKMKEALHVNWEKPALNQQLQHINLSLSL